MTRPAPPRRASLTVTIHGANDAPVLAAQTANQTANVGSLFSLPLQAGTFTDVDGGDTLTYTATAADGSALPAWLTFTPATRSFSGTPTTTGTLDVKVTATDSGGLAASETFNIVTSAAPPPTFSLFNASSTPAQTCAQRRVPDRSRREVPVVNVAGQVTALKFYRSTGDTATDILDLWSATGTKLASATFTNTAASGWQTVTLPTPVSITANTTYVASYHTTGAYVATNNFFTSAVTSGPLTAPATTTIRRQWRLCLWRHRHDRHLPDQHLRCRQLLGRCRVRRGRGNNAAPTAVADTGDATEKGGVANGSGGSLATGNVLTNDTDPDAGDSKTVTAVSFGATAGTLGTALNGAHGSLVLNAAGAFTYTINENDAAVQALLIDQHADRCLQLHHA